MQTALAYWEIQSLTSLLCLITVARLWLENCCPREGFSETENIFWFRIFQKPPKNLPLAFQTNCAFKETCKPASTAVWSWSDASSAERKLFDCGAGSIHSHPWPQTRRLQCPCLPYLLVHRLGFRPTAPARPLLKIKPKIDHSRWQQGSAR